MLSGSVNCMAHCLINFEVVLPGPGDFHYLECNESVFSTGEFHLRVSFRHRTPWGADGKIYALVVVTLSNM